MDETNSKLKDLLFFLLNQVEKEYQDKTRIGTSFYLYESDNRYELQYKFKIFIYISKSRMFPNVHLRVNSSEYILVPLSLKERYNVKKELKNIIKIIDNIKTEQQINKLLAETKDELKTMHKEKFNDKADDLINGK